MQTCVEHQTSYISCGDFEMKVCDEMGDLYVSSIISEPCSALNRTIRLKWQVGPDPCEQDYIGMYLNRPQVQDAIHANKTKLAYPWAVCSFELNANWLSAPTTMFPIYRKLISAGLRILLYSGDMDAVIPVTGTQYSIDALNLTVKKPWMPWRDETGKLAGYRVEYDGLTFATVRGAGHEVPKFQPRSAFSLFRWFLEEM